MEKRCWVPPNTKHLPNTVPDKFCKHTIEEDMASVLHETTKGTKAVWRSMPLLDLFPGWEMIMSKFSSENLDLMGNLG